MLGAVGPREVKGCGCESFGCLVDGINIQPNLVLEHVRVENDTSVNLETFPDHPSKGNAGEAATFAVFHGPAPDV